MFIIDECFIFVMKERAAQASIERKQVQEIKEEGKGVYYAWTLPNKYRAICIFDWYCGPRIIIGTQDGHMLHYLYLSIPPPFFPSISPALSLTNSTDGEESLSPPLSLSFANSTHGEQ